MPCTRATGPLRPRGATLAGCCLLLAGLIGAAQAQPIRIAAAEFLAPQAPAVQALLREAGFHPELHLMPAARSLRMLEHGEIDAEFFRQPGALTAFRDKVRLIGPLSCSTNFAFVRRDRPEAIQGVKSLVGLRVGVLNGNLLAAALLDDAGIRYDKISNRDSMFLMLERGRLDVVIEPERSGLTAIQQTGLGGALERRGAALTDIPNYLVLRTRLAEWGPRLEQVAAQALASGRWHQWIGDINAQIGIPRTVGLSCLPSAGKTGLRP